MQQIKIKFITIFLMPVIIWCSCSSVRQLKQTTANQIQQLRLLSEYDLPHNFLFKNTTVGGLSGIDYDAQNNCYYLISDDRSAVNAARFYTAKIAVTEKGIDSVQFINVTTFLNDSGKPYPNSKQDAAHTPDPEAIRYNPLLKQFFWTSEGERIIRPKDTVLENPAVTVIQPDGSFVKEITLPSILNMQPIEKGPRQNGTLEVLSFANNYKNFFTNLEEPLYEDGPRADIIDNNALIRIFKFTTATKKNTAQYAYKLEPVAHPSNPANAFKINGIPDILWIGDNKLLVIERSFSTGIQPCTIKIFEADLSNATDVKNIPSLANVANIKLVQKKLLLNMDDLGIYVDNVEGITFGPTLPNGHKTLLLVSDNNFSPLEKTQFFLFEIVP